MELGKKIRELREKEKITQRELANKLNLSQNVVNMWENSQRIPTYENFIALIDYFKISADVLIQNDRKAKPYEYQTNILIDAKLKKLIDTYMLLDDDGQDAVIGKAKELKIILEKTNSFPVKQAN